MPTPPVLGSAKPTVFPRWAETVSGTQSNITTPPNGKQDVGWAPGDQPPAQYVNWLANLNYEWLLWLANYFATAGELLVQSSAEATLQPVATHYDYKGANRSHVDHLGYRGGQVTDWYELWRTSGTTEPPSWTFSGTQTRTYTDPDVNMPYRNVTLTLAASASVLADLVCLPITFVDNSRAFVAEMDLRTGGANWTGANAIQFKWMIEFSNSSAWNRYVAFQLNPATNANIQTLVVGASTLDQFSTSVAIAVSTTYRLRVEIIGSSNSSQAAGTFTVRFYINGALVRTFTFTTAQIAADAIRHELALSNTGTALACSVQCGPIRGAWNHRLAQDLL